MNGSFSDKALSHYSELLRAAQELAFSEGSEFYDFTRCVRPDGTAYGTGGKCRKGSEQAKEAGSPKGRSGSSGMSRPQAQNIANALKKKTNDHNWQVEEHKGGHRVTHPYLGQREINSEVKKHLNERTAKGSSSSSMSKEQAQKIANQLKGKTNDHNWQVEEHKGGHRVTHPYLEDAEINRQVKKVKR